MKIALFSLVWRTTIIWKKMSLDKDLEKTSYDYGSFQSLDYKRNKCLEWSKIGNFTLSHRCYNLNFSYFWVKYKDYVYSLNLWELLASVSNTYLWYIRHSFYYLNFRNQCLAVNAQQSPPRFANSRPMAISKSNI